MSSAKAARMFSDHLVGALLRSRREVRAHVDLAERHAERVSVADTHRFQRGRFSGMPWRVRPEKSKSSFTNAAER